MKELIFGVRVKEESSGEYAVERVSYKGLVDAQPIDEADDYETALNLAYSYAIYFLTPNLKNQTVKKNTILKISSGKEN